MVAVPEDIRWVEVAPKGSQSTISLMVPNPMMMSDGVEIEAIKKSIGKETGIWFYSNNIQSTYEEYSEVKELILLHLKSKNGEVLCPK